MANFGGDVERLISDALDSLHCKEGPFPLEQIDAALEADGADHRLWHVKGLIHREQDCRELAIPALRRAAELAPSEAIIAHGYAQTFLEAGLPCVDLFIQALRLAPENLQLVNGLAAALVADGKIDSAIAGLEKVLTRSANWTDGHKLLAELRWANGERDGFTRSFDEAIRVYPHNHELRGAKLSALLHADRYDDVLDGAAEGAKVCGPHLTFSSFRAAAHSEKGDEATADRLFEELAPLNIANVAVRHVRHLLRTGRADEVIPILDLWLASPDQYAFWPSAATAWRLTGDDRSEWLEGHDQLIRVDDIVDRLPDLDRLEAILRRMHNMRSHLLVQSVRGGTQTDGNLFQRIEPEIVALREAIRTVVEEHARSLADLDPEHPTARRRPQRIGFSGAWSVRLDKGGSHTNHVHPMGWYSAALYIHLPPDLGQEENKGWLTIGEPDARLGLDLPPRRLVEPKPGRLVLFPSWMWHGTRPFGEGERITVAFDVAPRSV